MDRLREAFWHVKELSDVILLQKAGMILFRDNILRLSPDNKEDISCYTWYLHKAVHF